MADAKQPVTLTEYVVLRALEQKGPAGAINDGVPADSWTVIARITARSREAAIKAAADQKSEAVYNAVPASSFTAVRVAPKTTVQLELTEVKP